MQLRSPGSSQKDCANGDFILRSSKGPRIPHDVNKNKTAEFQAWKQIAIRKVTCELEAIGTSLVNESNWIRGEAGNDYKQIAFPRSEQTPARLMKFVKIK